MKIKYEQCSKCNVIKLSFSYEVFHEKLPFVHVKRLIKIIGRNVCKRRFLKK